MKKVIFSAIAMIAFVGSSMGSNVGIDNFCEENLFSVLSENSDGKILTENCDLVKYRAYNIARDLGYSADQASDYSYIYYFRCVFNNVRQIQVTSQN